MGTYLEGIEWSNCGVLGWSRYSESTSEEETKFTSQIGALERFGTSVGLIFNIQQKKR